MQVTAQALCLEDMSGENVTQGYIYYAESHQRQLVEINAEMRSATLAETQYAKLRRRGAACRQTSRLAKVIKTEDSVRFYFLCACCQGKVQRIGGEQPRDESIFFA